MSSASTQRLPARPAGSSEAQAPGGEAALAHALVRGTSALGFSVAVERGLTFAANLLAARIGGARVFGAYALALTTANNIANYAGAGIGNTANRYSGEYPVGSTGYRSLLRSLSIVSGVSVLLAVTALWFGAAPLATALLRNPPMIPLLRIAAFSAGAMILLESFKGLLIGQKRFRALLVLASLVGGGLLMGIPISAKAGPSQMVALQAAVLFSAVLACIICAGALGIRPAVSPASNGPGPSIESIWRFNLAQFAGVIGLNAAGWFTASMIGRADPTLAQMGYYAVANQLRNIVAMAPGLIPQSSFALLTDRGGGGYGGPGKVLAFSTWIASVLAIAFGGATVAAMPWLLGGLYGRAFAIAEVPSALLVSTAVVHMSGGPAASRLTIISLRSTIVINLIWAATVIGAVAWLAPHMDSARAAGIFLVAHLISAVAVVGSLRRGKALARGVVECTGLSMAASLCFACIPILRVARDGSPVAAAVAVVGVTMLCGLLLIGIARRNGIEFRALSSYVARS